MDDLLPGYRVAEPGEVTGGVLAPEKAALVVAAGGALSDRLPLTDNLMNMIDERLPKAAAL
jgi:hypothetical protein